MRGPGAPCSTAAECARVSTGLMMDLYEVSWLAAPPMTTRDSIDLMLAAGSLLDESLSLPG